MNPAHWHLVVNHLPIIGGIFASLILIYGIVFKNESIVKLSYVFFVLTAIFSVVASQTGESAEGYLKSINAVEETVLETHVAAADLANYAAIGLGVISLLALLIARIRNYKATPLIILALSLLVAGLMGRAGNLGGEIMHKEIRSDSAILQSK